MNWDIEERSLNAWPAVRSLLHDGWELRFSGGYTRRANSVNALFPGIEHVEDKIAWCESQYRAQHLPTVFKITPFSQPDTLDRLLEGLDYQRERETEVRYAPIAASHVVRDGRSDAMILPLEQWLDACVSISRNSADARNWHQRIVRAIVPAVCPVVVRDQGSPVAMGLGVVERGFVGIYDLVTDARYRRQGCATRILSAIFCWAIDNGARGGLSQCPGGESAGVRTVLEDRIRAVLPVLVSREAVQRGEGELRKRNKGKRGCLNLNFVRIRGLDGNGPRKA